MVTKQGNISYSRIFLNILIRALIKSVPRATSAIQRVVFVACESHATWLFQHLHPEALTRVPCDVTVDQPSSRVVSLVSKYHVTSFGPSCGVASGWIFELELGFLGKVALTTSQKKEIMAVQVHWMRSISLRNVIKYDIDPFIMCIRGMVEHIMWWELRFVALIDKKVCGHRPINPHVSVVQRPHEAARQIICVVKEIEDVRS